MKFTKKTRVFVTGCGGMLGEALYETIKNKATVLATDKDVNSNFLKHADVRDFKTLEKKIRAFKPTIIFHLAALTDLEYCERNEDESWEVNALATENVAALCSKLNIPIVYISTAGIFDGSQEFYTDYDFPNPLGIYAKSKYAGELAVQRLCTKHYIFRAGWMMGGGPEKDKKFVNKIMKQISSGKKNLYVVDDKLGTPTYTFDFIKNAIGIISDDLYGLYNLVCDGSCSRYDVAQYILATIKRTDIKLIKVSSDYYKKEYFAPRPDSEKLIPFKLKKSNLYTMRDWKLCLAEYLQRWKGL